MEKTPTRLKKSYFCLLCLTKSKKSHNWWFDVKHTRAYDKKETELFVPIFVELKNSCLCIKNTQNMTIIQETCKVSNGQGVAPIATTDFPHTCTSSYSNTGHGGRGSHTTHTSRLSKCTRVTTENTCTEVRKKHASISWFVKCQRQQWFFYPGDFD